MQKFRPITFREEAASHLSEIDKPGFSNCKFSTFPSDNMKSLRAHEIPYSFYIVALVLLSPDDCRLFVKT